MSYVPASAYVDIVGDQMSGNLHIMKAGDAILGSVDTVGDSGVQLYAQGGIGWVWATNAAWSGDKLLNLNGSEVRSYPGFPVTDKGVVTKGFVERRGTQYVYCNGGVAGDIANASWVTVPLSTVLDQSAYPGHPFSMVGGVLAVTRPCTMQGQVNVTYGVASDAFSFTFPIPPFSLATDQYVYCRCWRGKGTTRGFAGLANGQNVDVGTSHTTFPAAVNATTQVTMGVYLEVIKEP